MVAGVYTANSPIRLRASSQTQYARPTVQTAWGKLAGASYEESAQEIQRLAKNNNRAIQNIIEKDKLVLEGDKFDASKTVKAVQKGLRNNLNELCKNPTAQAITKAGEDGLITLEQQRYLSATTKGVWEHVVNFFGGEKAVVRTRVTQLGQQVGVKANICNSMVRAGDSLIAKSGEKIAEGTFKNEGAWGLIGRGFTKVFGKTAGAALKGAGELAKKLPLFNLAFSFGPAIWATAQEFKNNGTIAGLKEFARGMGEAGASTLGFTAGSALGGALAAAAVGTAVCPVVGTIAGLVVGLGTAWLAGKLGRAAVEAIPSVGKKQDYSYLMAQGQAVNGANMQMSPTGDSLQDVSNKLNRMTATPIGQYVPSPGRFGQYTFAQA